MESQGKKGKLMGGLILIALGILIILNTTGHYEFSKSWPLLLIVISVSILVHRTGDWSGWFIGVVGLIFFAIGNYGEQIQQVTAYIVPALLIVLGVYLLAGYTRGRRKGSSK